MFIYLSCLIGREMIHLFEFKSSVVLPTEKYEVKSWSPDSWEK